MTEYKMRSKPEPPKPPYKHISPIYKEQFPIQKPIGSTAPLSTWSSTKRTCWLVRLIKWLCD